MNIKKIIICLLISLGLFIGINSVKAAKVCCVNGKSTGIQNNQDGDIQCHNAGGSWVEASACGTNNNTGNNGSSGSGSSNGSSGGNTVAPAPEVGTQTNTGVNTNNQSGNNNAPTIDESILCCTDDGRNLNIPNTEGAQCASSQGTQKKGLRQSICYYNGSKREDITASECARLKSVDSKYELKEGYVCPTVKEKGACCKGNETAYYYKDKASCEANKDWVWVESGTCSGTPGDITISFDCNDTGVRSTLKIVKTAYYLIKYATPIILVIMGSIDFLKAIISSNAEEIDKNKKRFFNRLFIAVLIFILASIVQLITNILGASGVEGNDNWISCFNEIWIMINILR